MKIGIISPARSKVRTHYSSNARLAKFLAENKNVPSFFHPSLALLTVAALTPDDIELTVIDERVDSLNLEEDFDAVGITMMTAQARRGYEVADHFRGRGVHVVLGGVHPTALPEEAAQHCDTVIAGEAERTWPRFMDDLRNGRPEKLYQDQGVDLGASPVPRYDLVDTSVFPLLPIQTTRGCPYGCDFCSVTTVFGPEFRVKTVGQVLKEIEAIKRVTKTNRFVFNDDNTFVVRKKAYELLEAIKPLRARYFAQTDISAAKDEKLLALLAESGCTTLFIGFESLVPENLAAIQRNKFKLKHLDVYEESCKRIQARGIQVLGAFVVGFDHDTRDSLMVLRDFILENHIWAQIHILTPFPATGVRRRLIEEGRLPASDANWDLYTCFDSTFEPARITKHELEDTLLEIYEEIYSETAHRRRMRHMVDQKKLTWKR
jgi:radical SAM superfamily enzyme YgiQ (UPF0313 family)